MEIILFYTIKSCVQPTRSYTRSYKLNKFDILFKIGLGIIFYNSKFMIVLVQGVGLV